MLRIPKGPRITGTSPSDCLVSYTGHSLGGVLPLCRSAVSVFNSPSRLGNPRYLCYSTDLPPIQNVTHGHFIVGSHTRIEIHAWLFKKKMLGPFSILYIEASPAPSYEFSNVKQVLSGEKASGS